MGIHVERGRAFPRLITATHDFLDRNHGQSAFLAQPGTRCKGNTEMAVERHLDRLWQASELLEREEAFQFVGNGFTPRIAMTRESPVEVCRKVEMRRLRLQRLLRPLQPAS